MGGMEVGFGITHAHRKAEVLQRSFRATRFRVDNGYIEYERLLDRLEVEPARGGVRWADVTDNLAEFVQPNDPRSSCSVRAKAAIVNNGVAISLKSCAHEVKQVLELAMSLLAV